MRPGPADDDNGMKAVTTPGRRVLIILQNLPVPLVRRAWHEALALHDAGYEVSVITPKGSGDPSYECLQGIHLYKYRPPPGANGIVGYFYEFVYCWFRTAILALWIAARRGVDVIQACNPPDTYWLLALPFKAFGVRFVFDHHDLSPELYGSKFNRTSPLVHRTLVALEQASVAVADAVISTNESYRQIVLSRNRKSPDAVIVVRSGPDPTLVDRSGPCPELKLGRDYLCCYLGVMGPQDGVDLIVRAAATIVHTMGRTDIQFALLGFGDCLDDLRKLARDLDVAEFVTFTGRYDDEMLAQYLSTADLGLAPDPKSPHADISTHNKVLDYMLFGLPTLAFDLDETRVSAGDSALYLDREDAPTYAAGVVEMLEDADRRRRMGALGRERIARELSWAMNAPRYLEIFDLLTGSRDGLRTGDPVAVTAPPRNLSS